MEQYKSFYEMIKTWTIKDHYNPGIKAEIIWDMLLSEFVPGLVANAVAEQGDGVGKAAEESCKLIAKEFPIKAKNEKKLRNAKADYLVESEKNIYIVELKTTNDSYGETQENNYFQNMDDKEAFWQFYRDIIDNAISKQYCIGEYSKNRSESHFRNHAKYLEQLKTFLGDKVGADRLSKECYMKLLDEKIAECKTKELKLVYLSIYPISNIGENIMEISLSNTTYAPNDERWNLVKELISEVEKQDKALDFILE